MIIEDAASALSWPLYDEALLTAQSAVHCRGMLTRGAGPTFSRIFSHTTSAWLQNRRVRRFSSPSLPHITLGQTRIPAASNRVESVRYHQLSWLPPFSSEIHAYDSLGLASALTDRLWLAAPCSVKWIAPSNAGCDFLNVVDSSRSDAGSTRPRSL